MIILNLKTYTESTGENCRKLFAAIQEVIIEFPESSNKVIVAPSTLDLKEIHSLYPSVLISAQSVDAVEPGSTTGWLPAKTLAETGIQYVIYNHSEHRVWSDQIVENIKKIQQTGLKVIACCESTDEALKLLEAKPYAIAFEPKDLIGSGKSVSNEEPEAVKNFVHIVKGKSLALIGAGVSTKEDVAAGVELGADGFLLASAFVKAENPKEKLIELLTGGRYI